jgi:hypothetical protein
MNKEPEPELREIALITDLKLREIALAIELEPTEIAPTIV